MRTLNSIDHLRELLIEGFLPYSRLQDSAMHRSWLPKTCGSSFYKITKIVRALRLAERSVYMRVCKHGCGVNMFCLSPANHESTNLKKFSSSKLHKFTSFTHSFVGWNLENRYKVRQFFFALADILSEKNPYQLESIFLQNKNWLRVQAVGRWNERVRAKWCDAVDWDSA